MELNVTYHWTHLEYSYPSFKQDDTWGPVALITIMAHIETPFVKEKQLWGTYEVLRYPIEGNADDPRDQIIQFIQHYAEVKGIEVHFDFLEKWEKKKLNESGNVIPWDEDEEF